MRSRLLFLALVPAVLTGGCAVDGGQAGIESVNQPVVTRNDYALDLATAGDSLATGERQRLAGWLASLRLGYGDRLALDAAGATPAVRAQVAGEAARYGVMLGADAPVTSGQLPPGAVRVVLTRFRASVPSCPEHAHEASDAFLQTTSAGFGCAVNGNLAAMLAQPEDLVRGQPGAETADPATATKAIQSFRKAAPSGAGGLKASGASSSSSSGGSQ